MDRLALAAFSLLAACSQEAPPPPAPTTVDPFRARALEAARQLRAAGRPAEQARWVHHLSSYAGDPYPEVSAPAVEALHDYVQTALQQPTAASVAKALDGLLQGGHPEGPELLDAVLASRLDAHTRVTALWRLADRAETELSLFVSTLDDRELAGTAAFVIGGRARGSRDADLIRRLRAAGESGDPEVPLATLSWAMRSVGGDGVRAALKPWVDRLSGGARADLLWFLNDIDPWRMADALVKREILPPYRHPEYLQQKIQQSTETPSPLSIDLLAAAFHDAGRAVRWHVETDDPLDYAGWIGMFAEVARGRFRPVRIVHDGSEVRFENDGRTYRCAVRSQGRAHDLDPLVEAVNRALEDLDVPDRFCRLDTPPQLGCFILVVPDRFRAFASEFHLPLKPPK